jgi:two-component system, OmpR family, sensor histidine kinase KdpD
MGFAIGFLIISVATLLSIFTRQYLDHSNTIMIYLLCIVYIASRFGKGPSILASILSVLAFDFFCIPPHYTLQIAGTQSILTFLIMLFIALLITTLTSQVQDQAQMARMREQRSEALHALSQELSLTRGKTNLLHVAIKHIRNLFDAKVIVYLPDISGTLVACSENSAEIQNAEKSTHANASQVFDTKRAIATVVSTPESGKMTVLESLSLDTAWKPSLKADSLFLPLQGNKETFGVLQVTMNNPARTLTHSDFEFIQTLANQTALCMELASLTEQNQEAQLKIEGEQLRNALLSSVSHDLRTPLATITGASSSLLENKNTLKDTDKEELAQVILEESEHMSQLVRNLLEMTKLESGPTNIKKTWQNVEEIIGSALARVERQLGDRRVQISLDDDLPLLAMDEVLMQNVFLNLLENCIKYTPANTPIEIDAKRHDSQVVIRVMDRGKGIRKGEEDSIFTKFYRSQSNAKQQGFGLGLAICKAIVALHGGKISARSRDGGGSIFSIEFPIDRNPPLTEMTEDKNAPLKQADSALPEAARSARIENRQETGS